MTGIGGRLLAGIMLAALGAPASADTPPARATWTTLGTNSGPIPRKDRSEPANLLRYGDQAILVDAGDGASVQLAKAGVPLAGLHALVISHLHWAVIGRLRRAAQRSGNHAESHAPWAVTVNPRLRASA